MKEYLVPNYFDHFKCKCGECRNSCCKGWNVTISLKEYYRLQSLNCSKKLRRKLDDGIKILFNPTPERYAYLVNSYSGDCYMHDVDGYCSLQKECGEGVLPAICRLYPRSFCNSYHPQACISNSCEKIIEMFLETKEPITFKKELLDFNFTIQEKYLKEETYLPIQMFCLDVMSNRKYSIFERISMMEDILLDLEKESLEKVKTNYQKDIYKTNVIQPDYESSYLIWRDVYQILGERSPSLSIYKQDIEQYYQISINDDHQQALLFKEAVDNLHKIDNIDILIEKVLINHMFYTSFPFELDNLYNKSYKEQYVAFLATYGFMNYLIASVMESKNNKDLLVDVISEIYRLVEHSNFSRNVNVILDNKKGLNKQTIKQIIY